MNLVLSPLIQKWVVFYQGFDRWEKSLLKLKGFPYLLLRLVSEQGVNLFLALSIEG
jgi:hypothetical protein